MVRSARIITDWTWGMEKVIGGWTRAGALNSRNIDNNISVIFTSKTISDKLYFFIWEMSVIIIFYIDINYCKYYIQYFSLLTALLLLHYVIVFRNFIKKYWNKRSLSFLITFETLSFHILPSIKSKPHNIIITCKCL